MKVLTIFLVVLVAENTSATVVSHSDPSACQRIIKFMLITACGATKRESHALPTYQVMTEEEIEERYHAMVRARMIKGIEENVYKDNLETNHIDSDDTNETKMYDKPIYRRLKRGVIGISLHGHMKTYAETSEHDRRGSFHFIGRLPPEKDDREDRSPPPGELKTKCCGGALCSMDDFRGFCE